MKINDQPSTSNDTNVEKELNLSDTPPKTNDNSSLPLETQTNTNECKLPSSTSADKPAISSDSQCDHNFRAGRISKPTIR